MKDYLLTFRVIHFNFYIREMLEKVHGYSTQKTSNAHDRGWGRKSVHH